jgi:mannose-6-phosphate isomerase-like protein (cupin superfamily)
VRDNKKKARRDTMSHQRLDFRSLPWERPAPGIRSKAFVTARKKLRLAEFTEELCEKDWCLKEHLGYVIEGRMTIDFDREAVEFKTGNGFYISEGERHKARIVPGRKARLIMLENA